MEFYGIVELLRLEKASEIRIQPFPGLPRAPLSHIPKCHIHTDINPSGMGILTLPMPDDPSREETWNLLGGNVRSQNSRMVWIGKDRNPSHSLIHGQGLPLSQFSQQETTGISRNLLLVHPDGSLGMRQIPWNCQGKESGNGAAAPRQPAGRELFPCLKMGIGSQKLGGIVNQSDCSRALE